MARPNFSFQKRQKEVAREQKRQEKLARKRERASAGESPEMDVEAQPGEQAESAGESASESAG